MGFVEEHTCPECGSVLWGKTCVNEKCETNKGTRPRPPERNNSGGHALSPPRHEPLKFA